MISHTFIISYLNLKDGSGIMSILKPIWVSILTKMKLTDIEGQLKRRNRIVLKTSNRDVLGLLRPLDPRTVRFGLLILETLPGSIH